MFLFTASYLGLFFATFLSATILPLSSEFIVLLVLKQGGNPYIVVGIATVGNSLGGLTNYLIGRAANPLWLKKFGYKDKLRIKHELWVKKWGIWLAFFSWIPFIGDPLLIGLGFYRTKFLPVTLMMVLGKLLRYLMLIYLSGILIR